MNSDPPPPSQVLSVEADHSSNFRIPSEFCNSKFIRIQPLKADKELKILLNCKYWDFIVEYFLGLFSILSESNTQAGSGIQWSRSQWNI